MAEEHRQQRGLLAINLGLGLQLFLNNIGVFYELSHGHKGPGFGLLAATAVIVVCMIALPSRAAAGRGRWFLAAALLLAVIATLGWRPSMSATETDTGPISFVAAVAIAAATVWIIDKKTGE